jgi:ribosomal protein L18E
MAWTEDQKKQAIASYEAAKPTPETSTEIIKDIAEELEQTSNGVRMVLVQAGVYVKKDATAAPASKDGEKKVTGGGRVSKETSINALKAAITAKGAAVDDDVLDKLTGKAAIYLLSVINA